MTDYFLTTQGMRVVEQNDRGNTTYQREYKKGEKIDVEHMDQARIDTLVESGDLTTEDPNKSDAEPEDTSEREVRAAALTGGVGAAGVSDNNVLDAPPDQGDGMKSEAKSDDSGSSEDEHDVDKYDAMDYSELQAAAKEKDLKYVGVSADDLRASLRS